MTIEDERAAELEKELRRAAHAKQIINDEVFASAVNSLREAMLMGIRHSAFKDAELREKLCQRYALLEDLIGQLQSIMETGELAQEEVRRKSLLERAQELWNG